MGFFEAIRISMFQKYATFEGRARRAEYWYFYLFMIIASTALMVLSGMERDSLLALSIIFIASLAFILPSLAVTVRRLHDTDRSGWALLIGCIPVVGGILMLVWSCSRGTPGVNRFGSDPLNEV